MNWLPAIPIDTLKSRLQIAPEGKYKHGIRSVAREIFAQEGLQQGVRTLYRGTGAVVIRGISPSLPLCAVPSDLSLFAQPSPRMPRPSSATRRPRRCSPPCTPRRTTDDHVHCRALLSTPP